MPSVLMVANSGFTVTRHHGAKIAALVDRGWEVTAMADYHRGGFEEVLSYGAAAHDAGFEGSGASPRRNLSCVREIAGLLRARRPDLFHCIGIKQILHGTAAAKMAGTRAAVVHTLTGREIMGSGHPALRLLLRGLCRVAWRSCEVIFENHDDLTAFVKAGLIDRALATHIPSCGIDIHALPEPPARPKPTVFIHASRMLKAKGVPEFIAAARIVKAQRPDARFLLLGGCKEDYPKSHDPDFIDRDWLQAAPVVEWLGQVKPATVESLLLSADAAAGVLLSRYGEGVPRFPIEASACGLPVITTDLPGCREAVVHGRTGYLCDVESCVQEASQAMLELLHNPDLARRMGLAARARSLKFDVNRVLSATLSVYQRAMLARQTGMERIAKTAA